MHQLPHEWNIRAAPDYSRGVSSADHHLTLHLTGGPADDHRILLTDLTTVANGIQATVRNIGAVLAGQTTGRGGRKAGWIEQATELALVAEPRRGSVVLELELANPEPSLAVDNVDLGPSAVVALVNGLERLSDDRPLPQGYDPGVLKALTTMSPLFSKGYRSVQLAIGSDRTAEITHERVNLAARLTERPLRGPASVEGVLIAIDLAGESLTCRIDHPFLPSVACLIPSSMRTDVKLLVDQQVHADGEGEFDSGADRPRRLRVTVLRRVESEIDGGAWRDHWPWQELALRQGTQAFDAAHLPSLFDSDDDLDQFLAAAHGQVT